jgi:UDP-glucose:(heptosyl)LPS alpha-1,3-glucosyltransferase
MRHAGTGGTERYLSQLAAHLAGVGHEVAIVCRSHEEPPDPGVRFEVLRPFAIGGGWRAWSFARAVERHVDAVDYDLVFGLGRTWSQDVLRLGGGCHRTWLESGYRAEGSAIVRSAGTARARHQVALAIEERALAPGAARRIIANSRMVKRDVVARFGLDADGIEVIYNGVDLERFHPGRRDREGAALRESLGLGADDFVVLFLGTGYARKGLDLALEAFPEVLRTRPEARLLVVGYDSGAASFEARAQRAGIAERTVFAGGRRDPEVCYAAADLYVLPTRYDPFANSTLEALACGLPVVTSTTNGAAELLTDAEGACVDVTEGVEPLHAALAAWGEPARLRAGAAAARALAERHGDQDKFRQAEVLFERLAERRAAGAAR